MPYAGQVDKTMGADTVGHLKHLLETELKRAREENNLDIAMFSGVDGRIFSSSIPNQLDPREYRLLNLLKGNLAHICSQLSGQNMMMSVQQFEAGTIIISGVGDRAFLVFLTTKPVEITKMQGVLANVVKTVFTTFARTPCIFVISTGFVVRNTRNARSPTPEMMIVPASNCWTDIIMFWPLSWLQMWARLPFNRFSNRYSRGSSWFGIDDEKMRPSTPENIAMSRLFSSRARFSSVSKRCFRWPTVSAPIVLSTWPA